MVRINCEGKGGINNPDHSVGLQPATYQNLPSPKPVQRATECIDNPIHLPAASSSSSSASSFSLPFRSCCPLSLLLPVSKIWPTPTKCKKKKKNSSVCLEKECLSPGNRTIGGFPEHDRALRGFPRAQDGGLRNRMVADAVCFAALYRCAFYCFSLKTALQVTR